MFGKADEAAQAAGRNVDITTEMIDTAGGGNEVIIGAEDDPEPDVKPWQSTAPYRAAPARFRPASQGKQLGHM